MRLIVLGAGVMGLATAHHALQRGWQVTVLEAAPEAGGMAAHTDVGGLSIERFYHFICKADQPLFDLLGELGIGDALRWQPTSMGYHIGGALHRWGDPVSLLRFPHLNPIEKLRYGLMAFLATRRRAAGGLEHVSAREWITRWCGPSVYDKLWAPLFDLKFHEYADPISAAWIWTRLKRIGTSRRSLMQEELGYLEGGSQTLVDALLASIARQGGEIRLGQPARRIRIAAGAVTGVDDEPADAVISTVPTPLLGELLAEAPEAVRAPYAAVRNIGVVCVLLRLDRPVTPHFWVNISDPASRIPGFVEFSNLRPMPGGESVVFVPYYMPAEHDRFGMGDEAFRDEAMAHLRMVNPAIGPEALLHWKVGRLRHAQPVCPPGFAATLPPVQTPIAGLQVADTCFYYPEDRGVSESVRLGREMAQRLTPDREGN